MVTIVTQQDVLVGFVIIDNVPIGMGFTRQLVIHE